MLLEEPKKIGNAALHHLKKNILLQLDKQRQKWKPEDKANWIIFYSTDKGDLFIIYNTIEVQSDHSDLALDTFTYFYKHLLAVFNSQVNYKVSTTSK